MLQYTIMKWVSFLHTKLCILEIICIFLLLFCGVCAFLEQKWNRKVICEMHFPGKCIQTSSLITFFPFQAANRGADILLQSSGHKSYSTKPCIVIKKWGSGACIVGNCVSVSCLSVCVCGTVPSWASCLTPAWLAAHRCSEHGPPVCPAASLAWPVERWHIERWIWQMNLNNIL